jgi:hypothetical protein
LTTSSIFDYLIIKAASTKSAGAVNPELGFKHQVNLLVRVRGRVCCRFAGSGGEVHEQGARE